jgi:pimeloyl-ACP methyl ester carboxylesterase
MKLQKLRVSIDGIALSALTTPSCRTTVLLIHGNSSCKEIFSSQISYLQKSGYGVVAADLPGHGESKDAPKPQATYSFPGYARVLRRLMDQLGVVEYHIVGWSLGGHVGLEMWYADPNVRSLLITGTPPVKLSPLGAQQAFNPTPVMSLAGTRKFGRAEAAAYGEAMLGAPLDHRLRVSRTIMRTDGRARYWMVKNSFDGVGIDEVLAVGRCRRPLAIVQGKNDPFVNMAYLHSLKYSNLWLKRPIMIDAGHAPHWQRPELFNRFMRDFLIAVN